MKESIPQLKVVGIANAGTQSRLVSRRTANMDPTQVASPTRRRGYGRAARHRDSRCGRGLSRLDIAASRKRRQSEESWVYGVMTRTTRAWLNVPVTVLCA
jgi:hypothetical protein